MTIGIASDHGGFEMKTHLKDRLTQWGFTVIDFGADKMEPGDDYTDYVLPLAVAVARRDVDRGIAVCGSGVGASIAANKVPGVRAALVHDGYTAHQGVEDDDMNILCMGGWIIGIETATEIVETFLRARFSGMERYRRRLQKVAQAENQFQSRLKDIKSP
jgi:ribose 5-phosphate isomerase B